MIEMDGHTNSVCVCVCCLYVPVHVYIKDNQRISLLTCIYTYTVPILVCKIVARNVFHAKCLLLPSPNHQQVQEQTASDKELENTNSSAIQTCHAHTHTHPDCQNHFLGRTKQAMYLAN